MKLSQERNASLDDGVWIEFQGSEFRVAHSGNMKFQKAIKRLNQPYRKQIADDKLAPDLAFDIGCRAMAEGLLLDWRNVKDASTGDDLKYSLNVAIVALKCNEELREFVQTSATDLSLFKNQEFDEMGK